MTAEEALKILHEPDRIGVTIIKTNTPNAIKYNDDSMTALQMAIEALEKQIPKKPMKIIDPFGTELYTLKCPICGICIACGNNSGGRLKKWTINSKCSYCGQAIDFSEWEGEG